MVEKGRRKKKKAHKKLLRRDQDLNPRTLSPEPSVLSIRPWRPARKGNFVLKKYAIQIDANLSLSIDITRLKQVVNTGRFKRQKL